MALKILSFVIMAIGFVTVFSSSWLVKRFNLDKNSECDFENEMNEDEVKQYKFNKAVVNLKMLGMLIALPGLVLFLILFR